MRGRTFGDPEARSAARSWADCIASHARAVPTPADPTRRDELQRLIASFPPADFSTGVFTLRPEKLRERLGLPAG